jgi:hypothetical protein
MRKSGENERSSITLEQGRELYNMLCAPSHMEEASVVLASNSRRSRKALARISSHRLGTLGRGKQRKSTTTTCQAAKTGGKPRHNSTCR